MLRIATVSIGSVVQLRIWSLFATELDLTIKFWEMPVLFDETITKVSIPNSVAQSSSEVIAKVVESACYSRLAEEYMVSKFEKTKDMSLSFYFGGHDGLFRQVPALHQVQCGCYDPRRRPWFVAASSGPKIVVLVIDVSFSMKGGRMRMAMEAADTIVDTLTAADSFAVIAFNTSAYQLGGTDILIEANSANKDRLKAEIYKLEPNGITNFSAAFTTAFDAIDNTVAVKDPPPGPIAILFMTDGKIGEFMNDTQREEETKEVIDLIKVRTKQLSDKGKNVTIFTYSLGGEADRTVTKTIACDTGGIWTPVEDCGNLVGKMSSYYKLFALGNQNAVTWVETYEDFFRGVMGTTVSVPVYDQEVDPPIFLGGELNAVCVYVPCQCNIISQLSILEKLLPLTFTCHLSSRSLGWTKKVQSFG
jgi:Mg-chelatase subunit ChlD